MTKVTAKQLKQDRLDVALLSACMHKCIASGDFAQALTHHEALRRPLERLAAPALDDAFLDAVVGPINATWQHIGSDLDACLRDAGEKLTNAGAMESVLDACRMIDYGGKDGAKADKLIGLACAGHGYDAVSKFLCKRIQLA